jgi:hypothetical protein
MTRVWSQRHNKKKFILLYALFLLHSQRLTTLYDIQNYDKKLLSHIKFYSIY